MTVERITLPAIRYVDERGDTRHHVPLYDRDHGWWTLNEDGVTYHTSAAKIREFADEWAADPEMQANEQSSIESYRALADLVEALEALLPSEESTHPDEGQVDA